VRDARLMERGTTHHVAEAHMFEQTINAPCEGHRVTVERDQRRAVAFVRGALPSSAESDEPRRQPPSLRAPWVRLGSLPTHSAHDVRFVQDRTALFAKVTFLVSAMFLFATVAGDQVHQVVRRQPSSRVGLVSGTLTALALWLALRGRRNYSTRALHVLDGAATLGICSSFVAMGHQSLQPYGFYTSMLSVTLVSITRAMIVPSVPARTLLLAAFGFAGVIGSRACWPLSLELPWLPGAVVRGLLEAVLWSVAASAVATVASRVIYGLQEKANQARYLGQYALEERIGQGGMGEIYRARHAMLRRPTALKIMSGHGSEAQLKRFEREVQLTARLTHPNTISIYDYGRTPGGLFYYAMELLDGLALEELVQRHGPLPPARIIHLLAQVCGALKEAHGIGLIHRDIKPANIYVCRRGDIADFVKVLDFGLVREFNGAGNVSSSSANAVVGTPLYLSPEAILDPAKVDARADIYGLGGVAYYLATGTTPFTGRNVVEICAHRLHTDPEPPSRRHVVPQDLERVILSCLAKDPSARPQNSSALLDALMRCADAGRWGELEADAWWRAVGSAVEPQVGASISTREEPSLLVCRVDLKRRLERGPDQSTFVTGVSTSRLL
jgi:serine/threonine-protein kinase